MKLVLRSSIALAVLIAIPFFVALFLPRQFTVMREVTIDRPKEEVFDFIKLLKNQEKFSTWAQIPGEREVTLRGTDGTLGAVIAWKSADPNIGVGEQEITGIKPGERIDYLIRFTKPFVSTDPAYMQTEFVSQDQTLVTSVYIGTMNYPTNLFCFFAKDLIGDQMEISLGNLKRLLENPPQDDSAI
ncbi:SRPBCC family protein [Blastopirellula marina]|nr:SRPBCC family protein [Blastopirellula marina]